MNDREAEQILEWLTGCFGRRLEDNERMVWLSTLIELDGARAMEVALQFGKAGERFPTVPEFRRSLRAVQTDESWRELPGEALPVPEWVCVWYWSIVTRDDHRPFPQFLPLPEDAMSMQEYEIVRQEWQAAGSPRIKSINELILGIS